MAGEHIPVVQSAAVQQLSGLNNSLHTPVLTKCLLFFTKNMFPLSTGKQFYTVSFFDFFISFSPYIFWFLAQCYRLRQLSVSFGAVS